MVWDRQTCPPTFPCLQPTCIRDQGRLFRGQDPRTPASAPPARPGSSEGSDAHMLGDADQGSWGRGAPHTVDQRCLQEVSS